MPRANRRTSATRTTIAAVFVAAAALMAADVRAAGLDDVPLEQCQGETATIVGTPDMRRLNGTAGDDVIITGGARDVFSRGGNDTVCVHGPSGGWTRASATIG